MAAIICLANSRKNTHRCIAGMTSNGRWIRPVSALPDGSITWSVRQVAGTEPMLLDLLKIPLEMSGPDFDHQPENRLVMKEPWVRTGTTGVWEISRLCAKKDVLLHTDSDRVSQQMIAALKPPDRYSLQLIQVDDAQFRKITSFKGKPQYRATFTYSGVQYDIVITDPVVEGRLAKNERLGERCILTVSMGGPYEGNYFKFVAAVIEM